MTTSENATAMAEQKSEFRKAVEYILDHSEPYDLGRECLDDFLHGVRLNLDRGVKPPFMQLANEALYDWDI